jgi:hypothetical protein
VRRSMPGFFDVGPCVLMPIAQQATGLRGAEPA